MYIYTVCVCVCSCVCILEGEGERPTCTCKLLLIFTCSIYCLIKALLKSKSKEKYGKNIVACPIYIHFCTPVSY